MSDESCGTCAYRKVMVMEQPCVDCQFNALIGLGLTGWIACGGNGLTRYKLGTDPDTGKPCMLADSAGPWMCSGEVDRVMAELQSRITNSVEERRDGTEMPPRIDYDRQNDIVPV